MCYVGRLKGSMYLVNARLVVRIAAKTLPNTRLDLRNAANSLQIEGKGVLPGGPYHLGGRNTEHETIYTYYIHIYIYVYLYMYMYMYLYIYMSICICIDMYIYIYMHVVHGHTVDMTIL